MRINIHIVIFTNTRGFNINHHGVGYRVDISFDIDGLLNDIIGLNEVLQEVRLSQSSIEDKAVVVVGLVLY